MSSCVRPGTSIHVWPKFVPSVAHGISVLRRLESHSGWCRSSGSANLFPASYSSRCRSPSCSPTYALSYQVHNRHFFHSYYSASSLECSGICTSSFRYRLRVCFTRSRAGGIEEDGDVGIRRWRELETHPDHVGSLWTL